MPPNTDSDIAIIKNTLETQGRNLQELSGLVRQLMDMTTKVARMQERMAQHSTDIGRAFESVADVRQAQEALSAQVDSAETDMRGELADLKRDVHSKVAFAKGAWAAASVLWVLIALLLSRQVDSVDKAGDANARAAQQLERRIIVLEHRAGVKTPVARQQQQDDEQ